MTNIDELRCIHRHAIKEHPMCFLNGKLSWQTKAQLRKLDIPWYNLPGLKIGYIDIEVSNLNPEFGFMISWAIKEKDSDVYYDVASKKEIQTVDGEVRILKSLLREMGKYTILVGYYSGDRHFDIPYIRTKALHYGLDFFDYDEQFHFDLYPIAKAKLKLRSYRLANVTDYLGIPGKTPLEPSVWRAAMFGDPKAVNYVLEHNIADVDITEQLHNKLEPYAKWSKKSI